jgi:hypothetical protein
LPLSTGVLGVAGVTEGIEICGLFCICGDQQWKRRESFLLFTVNFTTNNKSSSEYSLRNKSAEIFHEMSSPWKMIPLFSVFSSKSHVFFLHILSQQKNWITHFRLKFKTITNSRITYWCIF